MSGDDGLSPLLRALRRSALPCLIALTSAACALATTQREAAAPPKPEWPELLLQGGHHSIMGDVAFTPDGRWLVSGNQDRTAKLWDVRTGRELRTFTGHSGMIWRLAVSPDGATLGTASNDWTLRVWDIGTGRLRYTRRHDGPVWSVAVSPDSRLIASGSGDRTIRVWSLADGRALRTIRQSDEVNRLVFVDATRLASAAGSTLGIWDALSGARLAVLPARPADGFILSLALSPDRARLAFGGGDGEIGVWEISGAGGVTTLVPRAGKHHGVYSLAFTPDGRRLAAYPVGGVKLLDATTGATLAAPPEDEASGANMTLAFSPDGATLAVASGHTLALRDPATWRTLAVFGSEIPQSTAPIALSRDGRVLVLGSSDGALRLWDLAAGGQVRTLRGHTGGVTSVAVSGDGLWLASSADEIGVATGKYDPVVRLWSAQDGRLARELAGHVDGVLAVAFTPDGRVLASGGRDKTVRLWDTATGRTLHALRGHAGEVTALAISPDGRILASGGGLVDWRHWEGDNQPLDKTIRLWDVATGREIRTLTGSAGTITSLAFSPDGRFLGSGHDTIETRERGGGPVDRAVRVWDVASGRVVRTLATRGEPNQVAFSADGARLVTAGGSVQVWDAASGRELRTIRTPDAARARFTPDGRWLLVTLRDGSVRVWDASTGELAATLLSLTAGANWLTVTPDGLFDGSPRGWRRILWRFGEATLDVAPVEVFFREFYRPGLLADVLAGRRPRARRDFTQLDRRQPRLDVTLPDGTEAGTRTTRVRIGVAEAPPDAAHPAGSGARDVRLFRNGSLVKIWRGDVLHGAARVELETAVRTMGGEQRLTAYAFNAEDVKSEDAEVVVRGADALRRRGVAYIVAVGVNQYANRDFNLRYAVPDAREFTATLARALTALGLFERVEVVRLEDRDATRAGIVRTLEALRRAEPEDAVIVYFAGHGLAADRRFYLIPHDLGYAGRMAALDGAGVDAIAAHGVSDIDLAGVVEAIDAGRVVLVIDACNSGQALEADDRRQGPLNSQGLAQLAYDKGMDVLTAAQGYQAALESTHLGHGLLTYALVEEALKTDAADTDPRDGVVTGREWLDYAVRRVPQLQRNMMEDARRAGREIAVVDGEERKDVEDRTLQRPRVFYRRDADVEPFPVARP
ncbi:MAG TPA: caspase family protein [Methylomirabilota bacterium]